MGISVRQLSQEAAFKKLKGTPIFLNDLPIMTEEDREKADTLTSTTFDQTDVFSNTPSCECGHLQDGFRIGSTCPKCKTKVEDTFDQVLEARIWIRRPVGVQKLINPHALTMMRKHLKIKEFNFLDWMIDTSYVGSRKALDLDLDRLIAAGLERGYNNFYLHFEKNLRLVYNHLFEKRGVLRRRERNPDAALDGIEQGIEDLVTLMLRDKDIIFSEYIAVPNKVMMLIEKTPTGAYIDSVIVEAADAIKTIRGIDTSMYQSLTTRIKENRTAKVLLKLALYYENFIDSVLAKKVGMMRRQIYGNRAHFSMRCVISALTDPHAYDELHVPWAAALSTFKLHLTNKLFKRGYSQNEALGKLLTASYKYDKELDDLFKELIQEFGGGIPAYYNRNPSLKRGSYEQFRITRVKIDVTDFTISSPILATAGFNNDRI
jgi:hypothetical protein